MYEMHVTYVCIHIYCFFRNTDSFDIGSLTLPSLAYTAVHLTSNFSICGLLSNGHIECKGVDSVYVLQSNLLSFLIRHTTSLFSPRRIEPNSYPLVDVVTGSQISCGIQTNDKITCWGGKYEPISLPFIFIYFILDFILTILLFYYILKGLSSFGKFANFFSLARWI